MRAILRRRHPAVADFQHVGIIPVYRPGIAVYIRLGIENVHHAHGTATAVRPLLLASPVVLDVTSRAPQIPANLGAPQPWLGFAPLADAEHNRTTSRVESLPDVVV